MNLNTNIGYFSNDIWLPFINNFKNQYAYCYWVHYLERMMIKSEYRN